MTLRPGLQRKQSGDAYLIDVIVVAAFIGVIVAGPRSSSRRTPHCLGSCIHIVDRDLTRLTIQPGGQARLSH